MFAGSPRQLVALVFGLVSLAAPVVLHAEALDEPACNALKNEQARLAAEGLKTDMLRGADWAKSNLPPARLEQIKHLMEVEESLAFRCPQPKPPPVAATAAAPAASENASEANKPVVKKRAKKKVEPAATADDQANESEAPKPVKPAQKKKAKAKKEPADDAYVPPPASGNAFVDNVGEPAPQPGNAASQKSIAP